MAAAALPATTTTARASREMVEKCFRFGCNVEPSQSATITSTNHERRTIHFCQQCYITLERDRIIISGKVIKL
jgi:formate dehydrogenase assembly factor FdhD